MAHKSKVFLTNSIGNLCGNNKQQFGAMQIATPTLFPRCLPYRLPSNESVTVVGQVLNLNQTARKLILQPDLDSNFSIEVTLPQSLQCAQLRNIKFLEVRGRAISASELILKEYCNFKENFDLKTYNQVLKLSVDNKLRHIFGNR